MVRFQKMGHHHKISHPPRTQPPLGANDDHQDTECQLLRRQSQHDDPHVRHRRIQPHQTPPSHHPPPPLLVRPPRPTTPKPHHAALVAQRKGPTTAKETSPLSTNPYDALRKVIEHEANQDDDGGFFARLGGIEPDNDDDGPTTRGLFQHWDTERDGTPVFAKYSDSTGPGRNIKKGRSSGPHLQWVKNTTGKIEDIITREEWDKANPPLSQPKKSFFDHMIDAFKPLFKPQPKRQPIVKVQKTQTGWLWTCRICDHFFMSTKWSIIIKAATHHAHNHH